MACLPSSNWTSLKRLIPCFRQAQLQQIRTKVVLKRKHEVPLVPLDEPIYNRKLKGKHFIYEVVEDTRTLPIPPITCILTRHVDGIGAKGETVSVRRGIFRTHLLPSGAAVYASPENIKAYEEINLLSAHEKRKTQFALRTYRTLSGMNLPVRMNAFTPWTLTKSNIKVAFRLAGICVEDEESIILPEEPITNKQDEKVTFQIKVKVNGLDEATVNCYKVPITSDPDRKAELPESLELPLHRNRADVEKELKEKGLYNGTV